MVSLVENSEIKPKYKNVKVIHTKLPSINFRPNHLNLILQNLIINAVKFNNNDEKIIKVSSKIDSKNLFLYVEANGIGIDDDFKEIIFQPFKKLHVYDKYAGSGLYIVSEILNDYDSTIALSKSKQGGSIFTIKLPIELLSN